MGRTTKPQPPPDAAAIRAELDRLAGGPLASSPQLERFLQFVVGEALSGRGELLKEYTVAVQGLGRPASFDPATDAAVRVAARQLRFKLAEYYSRSDIPGDVSIDLPKGGYVPTFSHRRPATVPLPPAPAPDRVTDANRVTIPSAASAPRTRPPWPARLVAGIALLGMAGFAASRLLRTWGDASPPPVIAVLPFENLTGSNDDVMLSDGLSDEITSALARDTATRVVARTSAWKFRAQPVDIRDVGRQLGATHIVEGSVRRSGDRYRISVQVNASSDGIRVWAEQYEVDRASAFGLFDLIAQNVHHAVVTHTRSSLDALPARRAPTDPRVAEWLLEGRYFWNQRTDSGFRRAIDVLERATRADSSYAPAWAALAGVYATMEVNHSTPPGQSAKVALASAERALALDSTLGEAWTVIGMMRGFHEWRWAAADSAFQRAVVLSPNYATAHSWYSNVLTARNEVNAAVAHLESARRLDPLSVPIAYGVAQAYYYGRRWNEGLIAIDRAIALNPDNTWATLLKGKLLKGAGRRDEARAIFAQLGDSVELALLDERRRVTEIPRLMGKLTAEESSRAQFWIATNYAQIGWSDSAFTWLERAFAVRQSDLSSILADPMIDPLKSDARYEALVQRIGLAPPAEGSANR